MGKVYQPEEPKYCLNSCCSGGVRADEHPSPVLAQDTEIDEERSVRTLRCVVRTKPPPAHVSFLNRFLTELLQSNKEDLPERELSALEEILKYEVIKDAAKDTSLKAGQALAQYLLAQL